MLLSEKIFLMIITNNDIYNITHENTKINYEKLTIIINDFLNTKNLEIKDIIKFMLIEVLEALRASEILYQ